MGNDINNKQLKLTLPLPASVNHIYGRNKFGSTYLKKEGKDYKKINGLYIQQEVIKQGRVKLLEEQYCYLDEIVYMNSKGRDSDNLKKLTQDTITESEVVWFDDTFCLPRTNRIYIDSTNPRLEITITPIDMIGIFDSERDYFNFENQCKTCSQYRNGKCGVLRDSKDNRITESVSLIDDKWICTKFKLRKKQ
jgi:Holliday junction resolvase RusA-like endonuclease